MAEERRDDRSRRPERPEEGAGDNSQITAPARNAKKRKKRGKGRLLFPLLLLAAGVGAGLHFSGMWDARPLMWSIVPQIPYIGQPISKFFKIPEQYTLTVAQRRAYELEEWQQRLNDRERDLSVRESAVETASDDLGMRSERLARQEASIQRTAAEKPDETSTDAEKKLIDQVVKTYQDMSPRNAAQIVEQVREPLAVELLQKLPPDVRASILGKMNPQKAARLTEMMAGR
ncbi:MAG: MgtE intracellular region [Synergistaceae bacterium]|jgi:flagellar motility protein MotE (MotC chaperone)|nr:MgtE intracellular region [Synergistaceae bacterium]